MFSTLPLDVRIEIANLLPVDALENLSATSKENQKNVPWKEIAQESIAQLNQYIGNSCTWCDSAIETIKKNYSPELPPLTHHHIAKAISDLGPFPSDSDFNRILSLLECANAVPAHSRGPCVCQLG